MTIEESRGRVETEGPGGGASGAGAVPFDEALHTLCQERGVAAIYVFGPPAARAAGGAGDPDLGLLFAEETRPREGGSGVDPIHLRQFRDVFGADELAAGNLDGMGPAQQYRAIRGRVIYAAGEQRRAGFEERVVRDYQDFAFEMRLFDEERAEVLIREGGGG